MFRVLAAGRWTCSEYYVMWHSQVEYLVTNFICSIVLLMGGANMFCIDMSGIHLYGLCFKPSKEKYTVENYLYKYHHSTKLSQPENITSLLPSVLLRVRSMSNNAKGNN